MFIFSLSRYDRLGEMEKDFDRWSKKKQILDSREVSFGVYVGEIWWCSLGVNIGTEIDGKNEDYERPALILRHLSKDMVLVAPITNTEHKDIFSFPIKTHKVDSFLKLNQIRAVSTKRFSRFVDIVSRDQFIEIKKFLIESVS